MQDEQREKLLANARALALGGLASWAKPGVLPGVGPQETGIFLEFKKRLSETTKEIDAVLRRIPTDELRRDYCGDIGMRPSPLNKEHGIHHELALEIAALDQSRPRWFAGGWAIKGKTPDKGHWRSASTISLVEASLLSVGVDPRFVDFDDLFKAYGEDWRTDQVLYFLDDRFEEISRGLSIPPSNNSQVIVSELVAWVNRHEIRVPYEFREVFSDHFHVNRPADIDGATRVGPQLHHHTESMMQRVIVAMAIRHHGMTQDNDAAPIAKKIVSDGHFVGFSLTKRNLVKILRAGYRQLDPEAKEVIKAKK